MTQSFLDLQPIFAQVPMPVQIAGWFVVGILAIILFIFFITFGRLYIQALSSGVRIGVLEFIGMWLRKVNPRLITDCLIMANKAGLKDVQANKLEAHYMAKGNVQRVTQALVAASKAHINLNFDQAAAIDLAGRDVLDAVIVALCRLVGVIRSFACFQGSTPRFVFTKSFWGPPESTGIHTNSYYKSPISPS